MADNTPLTDEQIRAVIAELYGLISKVGLNLAAFQKLLLSKHYLTESEISAALTEVEAEAKAVSSKIADALRRGPSGGVQ